MEGDGPTVSVVLRQYLKLQMHLKNKLEQSTPLAPFYAMFHAMLVQLREYLKEAMTCDTLLMAAMLHPSWRLAFFNIGFGAHSPTTLRVKSLLEDQYGKQQSELEVKAAQMNSTISSGSTPRNKSDEDSDDANSTTDPDDPMIHLHQAPKQKYTFDEIATYQLAEDAPSRNVGENPHLALKWWRVGLFFFRSLQLIVPKSDADKMILF